MDLEIHIRPNRSWFRIDWRDLWDYRDLFGLMVRRDFLVKYKQTILGPAWFILQPLMTTLIFTVIFNRVAKIPTDGLPPFLFYLCGQLGWNYFVTTLTATSNTLTLNAGLFGKVYFPRLVVPFSIATSNLLAFLIQFATFACFWIYFRFFTSVGHELVVSVAALWLPLLVFQTALLALGVGLISSAITAKYKDLIHALTLLTQLWLYATPVIYPLSQVPQKWLWLIEMNPMASIVEAYKKTLLGEGTVNLGALAYSITVTLLLFFVGLMFFHKAERTFIDTV
jgi:lipopolysaccharide transport system permease protein